MNGTQIEGLQVLSVFVSDIAVSEGFYCSVLGFERKSEMPPGVTLASGDLMLYLEPGRMPRGDSAGTQAEICPCFDVTSVKIAWDTAVAHKAQIIQKYTEYSREFAMFKIADPDGNVLEFAGSP